MLVQLSGLDELIGGNELWREWWCCVKLDSLSLRVFRRLVSFSSSRTPSQRLLACVLRDLLGLLSGGAHLRLVALRLPSHPRSPSS